MKHLKLFENFNFWYRGTTTNTQEKPFVWLTSDKSHAIQYSEINKAMYGGEPKIEEYNPDLSSANILDLMFYDMDEQVTENDIEDFLEELGIEYDYSELFDFIEDEIPLSRLVNKILNDIFLKYDGFLIKESEIKTLCIKTNFLNA